MDFLVECEDVASLVLQYLKGSDILEFKLVCSQFTELVNKVLPLHQIVSIFYAILNNNQTISSYHLSLPSDFIVNPLRFNLIFKQIKRKFQESHSIHHLITKFILHFHQHSTCKQFLQLPHNTVFLYQLANENYAPESVTFEQLRTINRLRCIIFESKKIFSTEDKHDYFVVDNKWVEENQWSAAFLSLRSIYWRVFQMNIAIPNNNQELINCIIENKELLLFLLTSSAEDKSAKRILQNSNKNILLLLYSLLCHSKWQEYKKDVQVQMILGEYFDNICKFKRSMISKSEPLEFCYNELRKDKGVMLAAVKCNKYILKYVDSKLKTDKELIFTAVKCYGSALEFVSKELKREKQFIVAAVKLHKDALQYVSKEFKADKEIVLAAVRCNGYALCYANCELKADKEIVLAAVESNGYALKFARDTLKFDNELILVAMKSYRNALKYASKELTTDKQVMLAATRVYGEALKYASKELKADKEVVLAAVKNYGGVLIHASDELQADKEVALAAVKNYGGALVYVSDELKKDKEVTLAAIKSHNDALKYISDELKHDEDIVIQSFLSKPNFDFYSNKTKASLILRKNGYLLPYFCENLRQMKEIIWICLQSNPMILDTQYTQKTKETMLIAKKFYGILEEDFHSTL